MPYKLKKQNDRYCVVNSDTGESKGCSDNRKMAVAHMRKLYMVESESKKEKPDISEIEGMLVKAAAQFTLESGESFEDGDMVFDEKDYFGESVAEYASPLYGAKSYAEIEAQEEAFKAQMHVEDLIRDFPSLARNIMLSPEIEDKGSAIEKLASELADRIEAIKSGDEDDDKGLDEPDGEGKNQTKDEEAGVEDTVEEGEETGEQKAVAPEVKPKSMIKAATDLIRKALSIFDRNDPDPDIMFWKEKDGSWQWLARYSNNFLDDDSPPDIISEKSHRRFVEMVDKGVYPYPELWIWHNKEWNIGKAVWCAYDDSGFAIATGYSNPGCEPVFEELSRLKEVGLSHGMPFASIARDPADNRVITEHQTKEISVLPLYAAANRLTSFFVLKEEEAEMPIPKEKKAEALEKWGLSATLLDQIETLNKATADEAMKSGLENKDKEVVEETVGVTQATVTSTEGETTVNPPAEETPKEDESGLSEEVLNESPSRKELAEALAPFLLKMNQMFDNVENLKTELSALKEQRTEDQAKAEKAKAEEAVMRMTPTAALLGMFGNSLIGDRSALLKEGDPLTELKPAENAPEVEVRTGIPFIDVMLSQPNGGSK